MNLVLAITGAALVFGLFPRRMTPALWAALVGWIVLVVLYHFFKS